MLSWLIQKHLLCGQVRVVANRLHLQRGRAAAPFSLPAEKPDTLNLALKIASLAREAAELLRIESELAKQRMLAGVKEDLQRNRRGVKETPATKVAASLGIGGKKVDQAVAVVEAAKR